MRFGVFLPNGSNGYIMSKAIPPYMPTWELNRDITLEAERLGFDFVLSMMKFRGFGGETGYWDGCLESFSLDRVETPVGAARSFIHPGLGKWPLHACSCSRAIAAFADQAFQLEILGGPLRSYTERTKTVPSEIEHEFATIRDNGYAECVEEIEVGVSSVAASIRFGEFGVPFSVGATGPIRRFTSRHRKKITAGLQVAHLGVQR